MPATRGLKKDYERAITPGAEAVHVPAHLAPAKVPACKAASALSHSTLSGAELPQAKKSCIYACRVALVVSDSF